jgi:hypothetical protein
VILGLLEGLAAGGALITVGYLLPHRHKAAGPAPALCSCQHGYGSHEDAKACQAAVERITRGWGGRNEGSEWVPCPCRVYDGPAPMSTMWPTA